MSWVAYYHDDLYTSQLPKCRKAFYRKASIEYNKDCPSSKTILIVKSGAKLLSHKVNVLVKNGLDHYPAKLIYLTFQALEAVSRYRDPQPRVLENYS